MTATLDRLPNELLSLISGHLDRPKDVLNLSLASRRLHSYTQLDGWKAYLKGRFALTNVDSDARTAVHGLTTLYRNWDRKAFVARYSVPSSKVVSLNSWTETRWTGPSGQTMGYQPKIDGYEEILGGWADRREVLAWSAGTHIILMEKESGKKAERAWEEMGGEEEARDTFDAFRHLNKWYTYKVPESSEGRDDITALKVLRPYQKDESYESIAIGSASGHLSLLRIDIEGRRLSQQTYATADRDVGSLTVSPADNPFMAVNLSDDTVALYSLDQESHTEEPKESLSEILPINSESRNGRIWSCNFLSPSNLAISRGPAHEPIQIYSLTPSGFSTFPVRKICLDAKQWGGGGRTPGTIKSTTVYPIIPIPSNAQGRSEDGNLFLSGGYDGVVRLHDLRSPNGFEMGFEDPTNDASIYSLALQGLQHVVAGTSMHGMLKVFDLRVSGSHAYRHIACPAPKPTNPSRTSKSQHTTYNPIVDSPSTTSVAGGWNLYLNPRPATGHNQPNRARGFVSPVYSLHIPSSTSPHLYCGLEGSVLSLSFLSILDKYPDPFLTPPSAIRRFPDSQLVDVKRTYDPSGDVTSLGMYEQGSEEALNMRLAVQDRVEMGVWKNVGRKGTRFAGLDERWVDPQVEGWARGQVPRGGRGSGRGGRGHRGGRSRAGRGQ